jgi:hypothetical protein
LTVEKYGITISIEFVAGADVPDEAYRFRKIFVSSGLTVNDELYAGRTVAFIANCPDCVLDSICCLLDKEKADSNSPVIGFEVMPDDERTQFPLLGKVSA